MAIDDAEGDLILPGGNQITISGVVIKTLQTFQAMTERGQTAQPETLFEEWLREPDKDRAAQLLDSLVSTYAAPLIRRIVSFKLGSVGRRDGGRIQVADIDDVSSSALYQLLARFERIRSEERQPVRNLSGYAAVTAYNACNEYFRARKPAWLSLTMKLRYAMTHSPRLALWDSEDGQEVCGFARLRGSEPATDTPSLSELRRRLRESAEPSRLRAPELAEAILGASGAPLLFDAMVEIAADWSGLKEAQVQPLEQSSGEESNRWERLQDTQPTAETKLIGRAYMARLWQEICDLPVPHRKALLLNLNDGAGGEIQLFVHLGVATLEQMANALEMKVMDFAKLWNELPLDDTRIARELGMSRQDVVNRRSAARKRLARRMREAGERTEK